MFSDFLNYSGYNKKKKEEVSKQNFPLPICILQSLVEFRYHLQIKYFDIGKKKKKEEEVSWNFTCVNLLAGQ